MSQTRDATAAKAFLLKTLTASHTSSPRVINVDKNVAYPKAFAELKEVGFIPESCELRQVKYLNNLIEQDHRFIKRERISKRQDVASRATSPAMSSSKPICWIDVGTFQAITLTQ